MMPDAIGSTLDDLVGRRDSELVSDLGETQRAAIKGQLSPGEYVVWAGRGVARPLPSIPIFPAFFAATLCALSGFALTVLFGIYGLVKMDPAEMLFLLCLAPGALGSVTAIGLAWSWARLRSQQRRISRSFYVLTDQRAIVGCEGREPGDVALDTWTAGTFNDTLCIEHVDGTGAVYFLREGEIVEPSSSFEGIREAKRVEGLIREVLLGEKPGSGLELREL